MLAPIRRIIYSLRSAKNPVLNEDCKVFEVNNWIISEFILNKLIPIVGIQPFPLNELQLMVACICRLRPTHIFEWGTNIGKSARIFYETIKYFQIESEIHSVDLPYDHYHEEHPKDRRGLLVKNIKKVTLHTGNGLEKSLEIYQKIRGPKSVLFFLDGDHSYDSVKHELQHIMRNAPGANILLHDTFFQSSKSGYNTGPFKALQELIESPQNNYSFISTNTGLPGMTLLYRLPAEKAGKG